MRSLVTLLAELADILGGIVLLNSLREKKINANKIYTSKEVSHLLKMKRIDVVRALRDGEIPAKKVGDFYRIPGQSVLDYSAARKTAKTGKTDTALEAAIDADGKARGTAS
ncbi:MAG: helix-turn-helix domain-containing protein [Alphaproteobacteria bacterium]|nr:helix-turn-helix domain-containing protein [Alphaproteobacteria bacterium]MBF0249183.1 helix-turn-helix domain-containing protein [Alphaproteobacteria bacterium]